MTTDVLAPLRALVEQAKRDAETIDGEFGMGRSYGSLLTEGDADAQKVQAAERAIDALAALIPEPPIGDERAALLDHLDGMMDSLDESVTHDQVYEQLRVAFQMALVLPKPSSVVSAEEWAAAMDAERRRQVEHGYDDAHDRAHGLAHLLNWAIDYARRGRVLEAATMMRSALHVLSAEPPTDDERDGIREAIDEAAARYLGNTFTDAVTDGLVDVIRDAVLASPAWRNRHRGPITDARPYSEAVDIELGAWETDEIEERAHDLLAVVRHRRGHEDAEAAR